MSSDSAAQKTAVRRILILFAHPALEKSRFNRRLLLPVEHLPGVTLNDLYENYPDMMIDVDREQQLLREHDVIVLQHPFYWYSTPAILKEWQDLVLQFGFAYGEGGDALRDKILINVTTTGGSKDSYSAEGINKYYMRQLLAPLDRTANLCGMIYLPPFVLHGTHRMEAREGDKHALGYRRLLEALRDGEISEAQAREFSASSCEDMPCINSFVNDLAPRENAAQ
ncbi:MAG: NAD(P)H-dependent oxidoreductase [bacterium]|nr:NAD(P)H-dependent oxidoreductase [bacterium]